MNLRSVIAYAMPHKIPQEVEAFAEWAFGDDFHKFHLPSQFLNAWNNHHDEFHLNMSNQVLTDLKNMIKLWKDQDASPDETNCQCHDEIICLRCFSKLSEKEKEIIYRNSKKDQHDGLHKR